MRLRRSTVLIALPSGLLAVSAGWLAAASWWPVLRPSTAFPGTQALGAAQALAFAPEVAVVILGLCLLLAAAAVVLARRARGLGKSEVSEGVVPGTAPAADGVRGGRVLRARGTWMPRGASGSVLPLVGALLAALVLPPATGAVAAPQPAPTASASGRTLHVVAWNVHDEVTTNQLGALVAGRPEVVVLPEGNPDTVRTELGTLGILADYQVFATQADPGFVPTTVLVSHALGSYREADGVSDAHGMLVLDPADAGSRAPRIIGIHTASPSSVSAMRLWREHLRHVVDAVCTRAPGDRPVVAAGDVNAVAAHGPLAEAAARGCTDALPDRGVHEGTWPSSAPAALRAQIDHVLLGPGVSAEAAGLPSVQGGSDHRPVSATVRY